MSANNGRGDYIGTGWMRYKWYSYCSAHRGYSPGCPRCEHGRWVNIWLNGIEHFIYETDYALWFVVANRLTWRRP